MFRRLVPSIVLGTVLGVAVYLTTSEPTTDSVLWGFVGSVVVFTLICGWKTKEGLPHDRKGISSD